MAVIKISGYDVLVDEEDMSRILEEGPWYIHSFRDVANKNRAVRFSNINKEFLHRFIIKDKMQGRSLVKNVSGDGLDCRKTNLKVAKVNAFHVEASLETDPKNTSRLRIGPDSVLLDSEDLERVMQAGPWFLLSEKRLLEGNLHYYYRFSTVNGHRHHERLHRFIIGARKGETVDHIAVGSTKDVRKTNLRIASIRENTYNRKMQINNKSGYKGVNWDKSHKKWMTQISVNGKSKEITRLKEKSEAIAFRAHLEDKYAHGMLMGETGRE